MPLPGPKSDSGDRFRSAVRQKTVIVENASFSETNRKRSKNTTGSLGAEGRADGPLFGWLILGAELSEAGQALGRLTGIALLAFGLACWPAPAPAKKAISAVRALLIYNLLATIYLLYLGVVGKLVGTLLWPAVGLHAILTILVTRVWRLVGGK